MHKCIAEQVYEIGRGMRQVVEKVKVSREVAEAIEAFKTMQKERFNITDLDEQFNIAINWWISEEFHEFGDFQTIHDLKFIDFCNAFYYGYEVEKTPEERIFDYYQVAQWVQMKDAIIFVLEALDIKIKGVND